MRTFCLDYVVITVSSIMMTVKFILICFIYLICHHLTLKPEFDDENVNTYFKILFIFNLIKIK